MVTLRGSPVVREALREGSITSVELRPGGKYSPDRRGWGRGLAWRNDDDDLEEELDCPRPRGIDHGGRRRVRRQQLLVRQEGKLQERYGAGAGHDQSVQCAVERSQVR